jgi:hypothetical protein
MATGSRAQRDVNERRLAPAETIVGTLIEATIPAGA